MTVKIRIAKMPEEQRTKVPTTERKTAGTTSPRDFKQAQAQRLREKKLANQRALAARKGRDLEQMKNKVEETQKSIGPSFIILTVVLSILAIIMWNLIKSFFC